MKVLCTATVLLTSLAAQAAEAPGARFTRYAGFEFEHATLADVQARLGPSKLYEKGDAGEYEAWICYSNGNAEVQFNSGEMGGGSDLLGITLIQHQNRPVSCPTSRVGLSLSIGGLALGQSLSQFTDVLRRPLAWSKNTATGTFDYVVPGPNGEQMDVTVTVLGTFEHGKLVKLAVWKIESF